MDDLTYGDLNRIRMEEKARASASIEVLGPVMEEAIRMMQPKPDPEADRKHWRRVFAANAMQGMMMTPDDRRYGDRADKAMSVEEWQAWCADGLAEHAYRVADAMLRFEDQEVPRG